MNRPTGTKTHKPMRLDDGLINLIENKGEGNNFTAKTESCLWDYFNSEEERKERIINLDKDIKDREKCIQDLDVHIDKLNNIIEAVGSILGNSFTSVDSVRWNISRVKNSVDELEKELKKDTYINIGSYLENVR